MSTKTLLTSEDLWKRVADGSRYELSEGELLPMTPVGMEHGAIVGAILELLRKYVRKENLGLVGTEIGFRLARDPDTVRAPDVAFVAKHRLPKEGVPKKFAEFAPDLAVEVLSPEDTASEVLRKIEEYLAAGVALAWVVDPATRTVTVYRSLRDIQILSADQELDGGTVLPGFRARVAEIFSI
ncbi:MAG: Uma2 family endonuclease [Acidobacteria bacterium]|nr:Uma2 family endonuclease [Acidobacteriota bacterium]